MAADPGPRRRYIVLPTLTAFNAETETASRAFSRRLARLAADPAQSREVTLDDFRDSVRVVDAIDGDALTLVEMTDAQRVALSGRFPGLQIAPEGRLRLLRARPFGADLRATKAAVSAKRVLAIAVHDGSYQPVVAADLVIVFNEKNRTGVTGVKTDQQGRAEIRLPPRLKQIDLVIATPFGGHWPAVAGPVQLTKEGVTLELACLPIQKGHRDSLDTLCQAADSEDGRGVRIAIIDAGVAPRPGDGIARGLNTTGAEPPELWTDNGSGHGTHVAGIVARLAPAAELHVYRVFEQEADDAAETAVARAIRDAVEHDCDLINLSLGQPTEPIGIVQEVRRARALGCLCVAAAGNNYQGLIEYPARSTHVQAVTACGDRAGWPADAPVHREVANPPEEQGHVFFAAFSACGQETDFIMPGAGIISHVSATDVGVMSGTSMASPAAVGIMARLLSRNATVRDADRNQQRSDDIAKLAFDHAHLLGLGAIFEGKGLLR